MSEEQLSAFLEAVKADAGLQEKLKGATNLDAAVAVAGEAGFDLSKADWLSHQTKQTLELSDAELEGTAGAFILKFIDNSGYPIETCGPDCSI